MKNAPDRVDWFLIRTVKATGPFAEAGFYADGPSILRDGDGRTSLLGLDSLRGRLVSLVWYAAPPS